MIFPCGFFTNFHVCFTGHFLLTNLLMDSILHGIPSRIINLSSTMYATGKMRWDDLNLSTNYSSWAAYSQSKLANILFTHQLARGLKGKK